MTPEDAINLREENITAKLKKSIRNEIISKLEQLMRNNPFGKTFVTARAQVDEAAKKNGGELPHFQVRQ